MDMRPSLARLAVIACLVAGTAACSADSATPEASPVEAPGGAPTALTESEKIERLLDLVAGMEGATFIRNGTEHTAKEAADHLRSKWKAAGSRIQTARDFVEQIATKSSMSGKPYEIRGADGTVVPAGEFFATQLAQLEAGR